MKTMRGILPSVTSTTDLLLDLVEANRHGHGVGLPASALAASASATDG
jgi:hypothetical protein